MICQNRPQGSLLKNYTHSRKSKEKRAMKKNLNKAEEDNINEMDEKIKKAFKQVEDNKKCRD